MIINIKGSIFLAVITIFIYFGAAVLVWVFPWHWLVKSLFSGALLYAFVWQWRQHVRRTATQSVIALSLQQDGSLSLKKQGKEEWIPVRRMQQLIHPLVTMLSLVVDDKRGRRINVLLPYDAMERTQFTRLRAQLNVSRDPD
ncbi:MAG: hypothetical protein BMS9Abin11_0701 [Gammaproteobacteria bacterium]|nr:MAG: hypothetical protein BMS9Abin11_0701 [Gammaproteobacteria bacterium]